MKPAVFVRHQMTLSPEEELFLRHWMFDEVHYQEAQGPAKRLQLRHAAIPADLAVIITAAFPNPADQAAAGNGPPPAEPPKWPWTEQSLTARLGEAHAFLKSNG
ncbi:MAG: hypothetical protein L0Y72_17950 [Gemmataceae bacterium]|nr:hypothetical protein [Gemmataceae bacterium]MCI0740934.1 hypothetical protein [Gemmataceae bacterium]